MKIIKWTILAVIVAALVFGAYQGFLMNRSLSELQRQANIQAETLSPSDISLANLASVISQGLSQGKFHRYRKEPAISPGAPGEWDDTMIDRLAMVRRMSTYYLYYAGLNAAGFYQIGLATSTDLINWTKEPTNPILTVGAPGAWDDFSLGEMSVIYLPRTGEWKMWYRGTNRDKIQIGLATSSDGISWTKYPDNPVVPAGEAGEFDSYMAEDAAVIMYKGTYYMCYSAMQATWETHKVGLATSPDGITWTKQGEILPHIYKPGTETAGFILVNKLYYFGDYVLAYYESCSELAWKGPVGGGFLLTEDFINWVDFPWNPNKIPEIIIFDHDENIIYGLDWGGWSSFGGVPLYVLPRKEGSLVPIEVLSLTTLTSWATSTLADCLEIDLNQIDKLAITVECTYNTAAIRGMKVHIRSSTDGISFDTADLYTFDNDLVPGGVGRKTITIEPDVRFLKVMVENPDANLITNVKVTATIGS